MTVQDMNYDSSTVNQLRKAISDYNERHSLKPGVEGYVSMSGRKAELVDRVGNLDFELGPLAQVATEETEMERVMSEMVAEVEEVEAEEVEEKDMSMIKNEVATLNLNQLIQHPLNPRESQDYFDPSLQRKILAQGGLTGAMTVRPTGEVNDEGEPTFYILDGNRRRANLASLVEQGEFGDDASTYKVNVVIREVGGDDDDVVFDEISTIYNSNESDLDLSPIGKVKVFQQLIKTGRSQRDIARRLDVTEGYVSRMMILGELPEKIQQMVHFEFNAEHFERVLSQDDMERLGIPFELNDDGEPKVLGITFNSAVTIGQTRRRLVRELAKEYGREFAEEIFDKFILDYEIDWENGIESGQDLLSAAVKLSTAQFKPLLDAATVEAGLVKVEAPQEASESSDVGNAQPSEEVSQQATTTLTGVVSERVVEDIVLTDVEDDAFDDFEEDFEPASTKTTNEIIVSLANDLEQGSLKLGNNWEQRFADDLRMDAKDAVDALNYLLDAGILVE